MRKDEQIQMTLQMKDKWEIDAHDVILGVEIGQGAFGLVMTGFYQNTQVAIKVLKGKRPTSERRNRWHNYCDGPISGMCFHS
jgi:hypothetical protein